MAIQLSMIVVITSCAPTYAFRKPAMPAQTAPAKIAAPIPSSTCGSVAMPGKLMPTQFATYRPTKYWPWPPMLNMPQRNANATARPVRMSVVVCSSVCERLYDALLDRARRRMEDPVEAGAVEDVAVREQRVVAGGEHDQPAEQERDQRREDGNGDPARALAQCEPRRERAGRRGLLGRRGNGVRFGPAHAASLRPPSISRPISSSETSAPCSPTISPS